jgi:hypothetical protein
MLNKFLNHVTGVSRRMLVLAVTLMTPLTVLGLASPASAAPKGEYAVFADCPLSNAELNACLVARTESGEITIGKQTVPIVNTQTLQGGFIENRETGAMTFVGAADGNTLSKTPQKVPGGLLGIKCSEIKGEGKLEKAARKLCEAIFENKFTGVNATTELAAPASSIGLCEGCLLLELPSPPFPPALSLPVKVHLENPLLGSECYIGSNSSPIVLNLVTGTTSPPPPNKPIKGKVGELSSRAEGAILVIKNNTIVDNSFAAPAATGCGGALSALIDPLINAKIGLPSAAGNNTAILNNTLEQTGAESAREHE